MRERKEVRRSGERGHDLAVGDRVQVNDAYDEAASREGVITEIRGGQFNVRLDSGQTLCLEASNITYHPEPADIARRAAECRTRWTDSQERQRDQYRTGDVQLPRWDLRWDDVV